MKPLVTFADPEALMRTYLLAQFATRPEAYKPATISTSPPRDAQGNDLTLTTATHVQIELEAGGLDYYPVAERAQVRFNCYAPESQRTNIKALAALTQGIVLAHTDTHPQVGRSDVIKDPDTGNLMVWFTALVDLRAIQLA